MKIVPIRVLRTVSILFFTVFTVGLKAQVLTARANTYVDSNVNGFYEWLPAGYNDPANATKRYPLLVYINGNGTEGNGSLNDLETKMFTNSGIPLDQQRDGVWVDSYTLGGTTYQFIVITPQFRTSYFERFPRPDETDSIVHYAMANYRVDSSRVYMMGHSSGGGVVWDYAGAKSAFANKLAAIAVFGGVSFPLAEKADIMKYSGVEMWSFHKATDASVPSYFARGYTALYNESPAPAVPANLSLPTGSDHNAWSEPLQRINPTNPNIYEWLLQYTSNPSKAFAGEDQQLRLPTGSSSIASTNLNATGTGPNGGATSYLWQKLSGPPGGEVSNPNSQNATATNLTQGVYNYQVTITDAGGTQTDILTVTVNNILRVEGESYTTNNGSIATGTTTNEGGQTYIELEPGEWTGYTVDIPVAGNYTFRFRTSGFFSDARFQLKRPDGTVLATDTVYNNLNWDNYQTYYNTIALPAGIQTFRVESIGASPFRLNYIDIEIPPVAGSPLPVNFTLFNANCVNGGVNLLWKTSGEDRSRNFEVEKSSNGRDWTSIASIPSSGQTAEERTYTYRDQSVLGNSFYRIAEVDVDGRKTYGSMLRANCSAKLTFSVYPNPVIDKAVLNISSSAKEQVTISVVDSRGAVVIRQVSQLPEGNSQFTINMTQLPKGTYTVNAQWGNESRSVQVIK